MKHTQASIENAVEIRPWFREPWVWFIIALPAATVVACAFTIWLAITRPDYLIVDDKEYQQIKTELLATPEQQAILPGPSDGNG